MNNLMKSVLRRIAGNIGYGVKHYHAECGVAKYRPMKPVLCSESQISNLVQKTIIPLTSIISTPSMIDKPRFNIVEKIDSLLPEKIDITPSKEIEDPGSVNIVEKKAHRMLRIRRKKMKKHQRRKLRKKMHFVWAKIRRKREVKKETNFRNEIIAKLKEAKRFNAEEYVASKLELYRREITPLRIPGGVIMPEWVVLEVKERRRLRLQKILDIKERKNQLLKERGTLKVDPDDRFK